MKDRINIITLIIWLVFIPVSCIGPGTGGEDISYDLHISNPLDGYEVPLGNTIALTVEPDEELGGLGEAQVKFFLDGTEIQTTPMDNEDIALFRNNFGFLWNVSGINPGSHTLKAEIILDNRIVARDEIRINVVPARWEKIDLSPILGESNYYIRDMYLLDEHTGWICGYWGSSYFLLRTDDRGATWQMVNNHLNLKRIAFYNNQIGVAISNTDKVYKTFNGGRSYILVTDPSSGINLFNHAYDVAFGTSSNEYFVTTPYDLGDDPVYIYRMGLAQNNVLQSTLIVNEQINYGTFSLRFHGRDALISNMEHYQNNMQYVWISHDGGQTWNNAEIAPPEAWNGGRNNYIVNNGDISGNLVWLCGGDTRDFLEGFAAVSTDGGHTWNIKALAHKLSFFTGALNDIAIAENGRVYAVTYTSQYLPALYYTMDNGNNWYPVYEVSQSQDEGVYKVDFKGNNFGLVIGESMLFRYIGQ